MRLNFETDYRPNYELFLALSWSGCGLACTFLMIVYSGFPVVLTLALTSVFFLVAGIQPLPIQLRLLPRNARSSRTQGRQNWRPRHSHCCVS